MQFQIFNADTDELVAETTTWEYAKIIVQALRVNNRETDFKAFEKVS